MPSDGFATGASHRHVDVFNVHELKSFLSIKPLDEELYEPPIDGWFNTPSLSQTQYQPLGKFSFEGVTPSSNTQIFSTIFELLIFYQLKVIFIS